MVPRILREGICSPSKFRRSKFNVIYCIERSTSSNPPPDGVDMCKKYQRTVNDTLGHHLYDDPNKLRPTVYIAHTSVFDTSKDGEKNTETLLESLQKKVALQQKIRQNLAVDEAQKNEASADDEVTAETDKGDRFAKDSSLQTDNVWRFATMYDGDVTKDDKLLQRPEPFRENDESRVVVDPPNLRPAHIRYRYEIESEAEAFEELAKKYLTVDRDQIDKRLLQDMERLGLPIDTRAALSPSININVSCEKKDVREVVAPKLEESQEKEQSVNNLQYYDQISWCNLYFKEHLSENPSLEEGVTENHDIFGPDAFQYDMLPLHCFLDFDSFDKSSENNKPIEKLGFEEYDDILPFHLLQCQDFNQLDLRVNDNKDKIDSPIESIKLDEMQPIHFVHQGNLIKEVISDTNSIEALEQCDFDTTFEDCDTIMSKPAGADILHSIIYQDMDVTKFDYTFPRDYTNAEFSLSNQHKTPKVKTVKDSSQESRTIIQIEDQSVLKKELKGEKDDNLKPLSQNLARPKVAEQQIDAPQKVQKATIDEKSDTIVQTNLKQNPKTEVELRNFIKDDNLKPLSQNLARPKVAEQQIDAPQKVQKATIDEKCDTIVQTNLKQNPKTEVELRNFIKDDNLKSLSQNLARPKVAEQQIDAPQKVQKATIDEKSDTIVQTNLKQNPKTEVELRNFINAKVMEQVRAYTPSENTVRCHEPRLDRLVQMNPQSPPNHELKPVSRVNLVEPKIAEQQNNVFENVQKASNDKKTEVELRSFINAKIMEQIGAHTATENTTQPHERYDRFIQMNPQSPPNNDVTNIIHAKVLEQVRARPATLRHTTNSIKGIDSIVQMQPQAAFEIKPQKVTHNQPLPETKVMSDSTTCQNTNFEKAHITLKTTEEQNTEQLNTNTAVKSEETKQPSRETGTIVQSCVQTASSHVDDASNKLSLDLNLSLSELLRRVRARNRIRSLNEIKAQVENMSILNSEKRCPPSDRPQCPPPPECIKPCPPPPKPKCPPEPPKCPPDPPKCPPEPPKCPPPKDPPKCPPEPPKCPPEPPKCPPEPKCPCPCPPPPKCPPEPPKCPCQVTNVHDPVTIPPYLTLLDTGTDYLRNLIELIKRGFLESRNMLFPVKKDCPFEITPLKLNRIKDFEPWTPVPSWPFPVQDKKRKLQCPYHGCPNPKPGPVRPNCPELPCAGFPKRLSFSDTDIHYLLKTD